MLNVANAYEIARGHQFPLTGKKQPRLLRDTISSKDVPTKKIDKNVCTD